MVQRIARGDDVVGGEAYDEEACCVREVLVLKSCEWREGERERASWRGRSRRGSLRTAYIGVIKTILQ